LRRRESDASLPPRSPVAGARAARAARAALGAPQPAADGGGDALSDSASTAPTDAGVDGGGQLQGRIQLLQARLWAQVEGADSD
jgi:hypothetical protein